MLRTASATSLASALRPMSYLLHDLAPWLVRAAIAWLMARLRGKAAGGSRLPCRSCPFLPATDVPPASPPAASSRRSIIPPVVAICLAAAGGCTPAASYVAAERATYEAIAPDYAAYIAADPTLDQSRKARRLRTLDAWRVRLEHADSAASR